MRFLHCSENRAHELKVTEEICHNDHQLVYEMIDYMNYQFEQNSLWYNPVEVFQTL